MRHRVSAVVLLTCTAAGASWTPVPLFQVVREGAPVEERGISRGAAWGDFDGDGYPDLFVTRPTYDGPAQENILYRNDGAGGFVRVPGSFGSPAGWEGPVWVDVDGDGDLDLHVVGRNGAGSMLFENVDGRLIRRDPDPLGGHVRSASMACWADADADGLLDVFIVGSGEDQSHLYRNLGDWRFMHVPLPDLGAGEGAARACAWGDFDDDHLPELVVVNARRPNVLLRNAGGMRLLPDTTTHLHANASYSYGVSLTDVNGDGRRDIFVANFDAGNALYLGRPGGGFEPLALAEDLQSAASKGHAWGDFDLDGRVDLYLGSGTPRPGMLNRLYLATGSGSFRLVSDGEFATHADTSAAVAVADYNLDGSLDVFVANWGSPESVNRLYVNTTMGGGWLKVRLEGVRSNRMGIGARVSTLVRTGGERRWLHRWLDASTGYAGQNEPVLHFGLGEATEADSLVVMWPSGTVDRFGDVPGCSTLVIREASEVQAHPRTRNDALGCEGTSRGRAGRGR